MFHRTPIIFPWLYPNLTWRVPVKDKILYLTLDDGPVSGPTEFALEVLQKFNAKATFFCIGDNIRKHPEIFKKCIDDGHGIGNHTFNHLNGWKTSLNDYVENVQRCEKQVIEFLPTDNFNPLTKGLFRPPYGRITRSQIKSLDHYKIIMWDVLTFDYNKSLSTTACLRNSIKATRPGSIIVFHDSVKAEKNMAYAFPRFIEHFLDKGFSFQVLPS